MARKSHSTLARFAIAPLGLAALAVASPAPAQEDAEGIVAAKVREQGYICEEPSSAEPDPDASEPDERAWILSCGNARFKVRLIPDMQAHIERME